MPHQRPERDQHMALAIVAALQSDPSGRTVHAGSNPYTPLLNGSFDLVRAARAANDAAVQWDAAYATEKAAVVAAVAPAQPVVVKPAVERRKDILAQLQVVDDEIIAEIEAQEKRAAAALAGTPPTATSSTDAAQATGATPSAAEPDPGT